LLKKEAPSNMLKGTLWKIIKKSPYFGKENYEIMKNFGGFGQILAFFF
jgi:hypothetical protein